MKIHFITYPCKKAALTLTALLLAFACADESFLTESTELQSSTDLSSTTSDATAVVDCSSCTYVVPADQPIIDGLLLDLKPGSIIGLDANIPYGSLTFKNIIGTSDQRIVIRNCGGTARINGTGTGHSIKTSNSKYFRITGGDDNGTYGIIITGGHMGLNLGGFSTNFEIDHLEIGNSGFAGIMAKTDPSCDDATVRGNFLMKHVALHHNYIHDTGGEGIYAGNSFFMGMNTPCGVRLPHEIHYIRIYGNVIKNTGWEAIQLGCATKGASIHANTIENYGVANKQYQNNGVQIGAGTGGVFNNNLIRKGTGNGLIVMGLGDNIIYNNVIDEAGNFGIFCDERYTPGPGFKFINNTIINPASDGIRIYAELVPMNVIVNNVIANPGSYSTYTDPLSPESAFVNKLSDDVKIEMSNNYFTRETDSLKLVDLAKQNYRPQSTSPLIDKGADISSYYNFNRDFYYKSRLDGTRYDIGAAEGNSRALYNAPPSVQAGPDQVITLPVNSLYLEGSASDSDGSIVSYNWTIVSGGAATLTGQTTPTVRAANLTEGSYTFRLTVKDDLGALQYDEVEITVLAGNEIPMANAGSDKSMTLPTNSLKLYGSGHDSDGSIVSYKWTQYGGPAALMVDENTAVLTLSSLVAGNYYFRLTVTDDRGATADDNVLVKVYEAALTTEAEFVSTSPLADAGPNQTLTLPANSTTLSGSGTDTDGTIVSYVWSQYGGPSVLIGNANSPTAYISGLVAGKYYFRLTVTDNSGATASDNMLVKVLEPVTTTSE